MLLNAFFCTLVAAAALCTLVAGFLFCFAVVVMPGFARLDDAGFLRAFQTVDGVIQRGQPLFGLLWAGSVLAVVAAAVLGWTVIDATGRGLLGAAALLYLLGVQVPTATVHLPLNRQVQQVEVTAMSTAARSDLRARFEDRWNRWNTVRTAAALAVSVLLLLVLLRT